jgi:hypothetical protein
VAGGGPLTGAQWLERHSAGAPAALRARVLELAAAAGATTLAGVNALPARLAEAGSHALLAAECSTGDRESALELLAADALITLALLAQAQVAPAGLADFARGLRPSVAAP